MCVFSWPVHQGRFCRGGFVVIPELIEWLFEDRPSDGPVDIHELSSLVVQGQPLGHRDQICLDILWKMPKWHIRSHVIWFLGWDFKRRNPCVFIENEQWIWKAALHSIVTSHLENAGSTLSLLGGLRPQWLQPGVHCEPPWSPDRRLSCDPDPESQQIRHLQK